MRASWSTLLSAIVLVLALPMFVQAQEASVSGAVTDTTGSVLPGVTITAVHEASGNSFVTVTDERGAYRVPVRTGLYRITAELAGFRTVIRSGLDLRVGQEVVVNLEMAVSAIQESVTVTGEAPLVDTTRSTLGGNIDPRQVEALPLNGRNWLDLTMLAPGARTNAVSEGGDVTLGGTSNFQLNIDGQQMTNTVSQAGGFGQPQLSRDAIAEFEFVSSRFDATQGRSAGVQVNAVTKSGTNLFSGSMSGYFRDDRFIAPDFVAGRTLPYSDQQFSATFGGPILKDRFHFFANYEYEREPRSFVYNTPYPKFNVTISEVRQETKSGLRLDWQASPKTRVTVRGSLWENDMPHDPRYTGGSSSTLSGSESLVRKSNSIFASATRTLGNRAVNEVKGGYAGYSFVAIPSARFPSHPGGFANGAPIINFRGFRVGQDHGPTPQYIYQDAYSIRNDLTLTVGSGGAHTVRLGGELLQTDTSYDLCFTCQGVYDAQGGPVPDNIETLFPDILDVSTWNLAPLSPIVRTYSLGIGDGSTLSPRTSVAAWIQDDWKLSTRLTLNLGLRYDIEPGAFAEKFGVAPVTTPGRPVDKDNFGPRLGFAYSVNDKTAIRGGFGKYYLEISDQLPSWTIRQAGEQITVQVANDGRPDFAANPFNGPIPTYEQALRTASGLRSLSQMLLPSQQVSYSYQTSIGFQRQLMDQAAVEADYIYIGGRHEQGTQGNINIAFNPATGVNYPFTDVTRRPFPNYTTIGVRHSEGRSNYHALQTSFTKRFDHGWQAAGTYTLSALRAPDILPFSGLQQVTFPVAFDLGGEQGPAVGDQRHRAVLNGIWDVGYGLQLSGVYFFGSGERFSTSYGGDFRNTRGLGGRLRPDGTIVPRNSLVGEPIHRVDIRVQRQFNLGGRVRIAGIAEVFNLFNHANYGSYTTQESNRNFRRPVQNTGVAYMPRLLQLGFRVSF